MSLLPLGVHQGYNRDDVADQRSIHNGLSAPADASAVAMRPNAAPSPSYGDFKKSEAQPSVDAQADQRIQHMDSVLTDAVGDGVHNFNVLHYGQGEVDKAQADSSRIAGNVEALKGAPQVTGGDSIKMTTPQQRMANPKMPRAK